jgi:hypothetical protein
MIVVVDTNAFQGDPAMRRRDFRLLLSEHDRKTLRLAIPEVVLGELPKLYREHLGNASKKAADGLAQLKNLDIETPSLSVPSLDAAQETYRMLLRLRLKEAEILMPPLPDTTVAALYQQAVNERRPFQGRGRGFKDALIWKTICELAKDDEVLLVTDNYKDFAESAERSDVLHHHLKEDLAALGHPNDRVRVVENLKSLIANHVPTSARHLEKARGLLNQDTDWARSLFETINRALWHFDTTPQVTVVASRNAAVENVSVSQCEAQGAAIEDAFDIDEQNVSLEVLIEARLQFDFTAPTASAEWFSEEHTDVEIDVWEDSFVQGHTGDRLVFVRYAVDFDTETLKLGVPEQLSAEDVPAEISPQRGR